MGTKNSMHRENKKYAKNVNKNLTRAQFEWQSEP